MLWNKNEQWRSTIPSIQEKVSPQRTTKSHMKSLNTNKKTHTKSLKNTHTKKKQKKQRTLITLAMPEEMIYIG